MGIPSGCKKGVAGLALPKFWLIYSYWSINLQNNMTALQNTTMISFQGLG